MIESMNLRLTCGAMESTTIRVHLRITVRYPPHEGGINCKRPEIITLQLQCYILNSWEAHRGKFKIGANKYWWEE